jgi:hypothetical protein
MISTLGVYTYCILESMKEKREKNEKGKEG